MADDIDDLLDEAEESLSAVKKNRPTSCEIIKPTISSASVKTEDLKDLLDDLGPPPPPLVPSLPSQLPLTSKTSTSSKCSVAYIGGTTLAPGHSQGATIKGCDRLRCLGCDLSVLSVDGFTWTPHTNYLFLRTHYPDMNRLRSHLDSQRGTRAYTCQCQCRSISETIRVDKEKDLKWICGGH